MLTGTGLAALAAVAVGRRSLAALPVPLTVAAVADLHFGRHAPDVYLPVFAAANEADVFAICGDLTDHGRVDEAHALARLFAQHVRRPIVAVLGNHDFEAGQVEEISAIFREVGVQILDGESVTIGDVGFAGVKGFCGGFGPRALGPWGEPIIKAFVQESLAESLKLETALARVRAPSRIALLHYAPVASTVAGEPPEIFPFLGSSRLEEPLTRFEVAAVFHGHAHHGQLRGQTAHGAPVFNVSLPLLQRATPARLVHRFDVVRPAGEADRAEA